VTHEEQGALSFRKESLDNKSLVLENAGGYLCQTIVDKVVSQNSPPGETLPQDNLSERHHFLQKAREEKMPKFIARALRETAEVVVSLHYDGPIVVLISGE
jgi:hypothetical protein